MSRVVVVTDSNANVPESLVQELDIRVVPLLLNFGDHSFLDGIDLAPGELYRRLRANKVIPKTAAPSMGDFARVYAAAARETPNIVSVHPSVAFSGTYNTAVAASRLIDGANIRVVDSNTAAMAQGFGVIEAARAAAAGADVEYVVARAIEVASKATLLAALGTLEYLYRGGRIGGAAALLGSALQIKPVVHVGEGKIGAFAAPRTLRRAIDMILKEMTERSGGKPLHVAVLHADEPQAAEALRQTVAGRFDCAELYVTELTPVMGAHAGPGVLGVAFYAE